MPTTSEVPPVPEVDDLQLPNLTRLRWSQPLVASIRLYLYSDEIGVARPCVKSGVLLDDGALQTLVKRGSGDSNFSKITHFRLSTGLVYGAPDHFLAELGGRIKNYMDRATDRSRAGAVIAVLLTELGWPVHAVTTLVGTSRPTVNRWVMTHDNTAISSSEIAQLQGEDLLILDNEESFLLDIRNSAFRTKRSGLFWKKAVFLPDQQTADVVKALWRIAFKVRGERSPKQEYFCSLTLDIMVELLLRRGVTALNLAKILGIQHAAVLQRNKKSDDVFCGVETTIPRMLHGFRSYESSTDPIDSSLTDCSVWDERGKLSERVKMGAFLLQVRTGTPTPTRPIPTPNISVLCRVTSDHDDIVDTLDAMPAYDVVSAINEVTPPGWFEVAVADMNPSQYADFYTSYLSLADDGTPANPMHVPELQMDAFGAKALNYPITLHPTQWENGRVYTEALLGQCTMAYDRDNVDLLNMRPGFGSTTHHWIPAEAMGNIIDIVPGDSTKEAIERRNATVSTADEMAKWDWPAFFPDSHIEMVNEWLVRSEKLAGDDGHSLLWRCLHDPAGILDEYPAPARHRKATDDQPE